MTGPTQISPGYIAPQTRERDDYPMEEDYRRQGPPPQRPLFSTTMATDYPPNYPMTCGPFQTPATTATADYMISPTRGQSAAYSQVPRSAEYDMYGAPTAGRGTTLQSPNQGQFASQQGFQAPVPYQDPRTGQMIYPSATAGRGFDQPSRHTNPADGRRR